MSEADSALMERPMTVNESVDLTRSMLNAIDDVAILSLDCDGKIRTWYSGAERLYGYHRDEVVGKHLSFLCLPQRSHRRRCREAVKQTAANGPVEMVDWHLRRNGSRIRMTMRVTPLLRPGGGLMGLAAIMRPADEDSHEERLFEWLLDFAPDAMIVSDASGHVLHANRAAERLFEYGRSELTGKPIGQFVSQESHAHGTAASASHSDAAGASTDEIPVLMATARNRGRFPVEMSTSRMECDGGTRVINLVRDATKQQQSERELRSGLAAVERIQLAMMASQSGLWEWDLRTNKIAWNAQMFELYGLAPSADGWVPYETWAASVDPLDRTVQEAALRDTIARKGRGDREFRIRRFSDGQIRYLRASDLVITDPQNQPVRVIGLNIDITERHHREEALRSALAELSFQKHALDEHAIVAITDRSGCITYANQKFCQISKYSREELLGQNHRILNSGYHPRSYFKEMYATIAAGRTWRGEFRNRAKDGSIYWVDSTLVPQMSANGHLAGYLAIRTDITKIKKGEEELRRLNRDLEHKNRELDEFSYVASHDLQEPLRKLVAFGELLPQDLGKDLPERAAADLEFIVDAARRMQAFVQDLLNLSRAGRGEIRHEQVLLTGCVEAAQSALAMRVQETGARIECDELPSVIGDPTLLNQLIQNLVGNALKFVRPGATPIVRVTVEPHEHMPVFGVLDNGIGIKPEYAECIFAPFKRLHGRSEYAGTGIGLAICKKVVQRHGGRIWVESQPGSGAHFKFTLWDSAGEASI